MLSNATNQPKSTVEMIPYAVLCINCITHNNIYKDECTDLFLFRFCKLSSPILFPINLKENSKFITEINQTKVVDGANKVITNLNRTIFMFR